MRSSAAEPISRLYQFDESIDAPRRSAFLRPNVKVSGRRRRSARMTGCAEPLRRHCRGTGPQHTEAVPTGRTPEAPSALSACPLVAKHEMENKRPCSARQDHSDQELKDLELRPTRASAIRTALRNRGERRAEGGP